MNIEELDALHKAATPGPLELINEEFFCTIKVGEAYISAPYQPPFGRGECPQWRADGAIIPAARNALPKLLAVAKAAKALREIDNKAAKDLLNPDLNEGELDAIFAKIVEAEEALDAAIAEMEKE